MKTELGQLTEKIQKACPELLELTFGCELEILNYDGLYGEEYPTNQVVTFIEDCEFGESVTIHTLIGVLDYDFKVIGHPITLEHILKWLEVYGIKDYWFESGNMDYYTDTIDQWEFGEPLHLQSPTLISHLNSL